MRWWILIKVILKPFTCLIWVTWFRSQIKHMSEFPSVASSRETDQHQWVMVVFLLPTLTHSSVVRGKLLNHRLSSRAVVPSQECFLPGMFPPRPWEECFLSKHLFSFHTGICSLTSSSSVFLSHWTKLVMSVCFLCCCCLDCQLTDDGTLRPADKQLC